MGSSEGGYLRPPLDALRAPIEAAPRRCEYIDIPFSVSPSREEIVGTYRNWLASRSVPRQTRAYFGNRSRYFSPGGPSAGLASSESARRGIGRGDGDGDGDEGRFLGTEEEARDVGRDAGL